MPSKSPAQHRLMEAVAHNPDFAKKVGIPTSVGKDFAAADEGKKFKEGGGLWDNIHAKRARIKAGSGEKMRKPGSPGAPTKADFKASAKTAKMKDGGPVLSVSRGEKLPTEQGAGLTAKGRAKYNKATGAHLQAPNTDSSNPRHKSFCARMSGMAGPMKDEKGKPTRKAASLARWKC
jgi:hypothetical protein